MKALAVKTLHPEEVEYERRTGGGWQQNQQTEKIMSMQHSDRPQLQQVPPSAETISVTFRPTERELFQLVKYWAKEAIAEELELFWGQCFGMSDIDRMDAAWLRVNEIGELIGQSNAAAAVEQAISELAALFTDALERSMWIVYRYGTMDERRPFNTSAARASVT